MAGNGMNIDFGYDPANDTLNEKGANGASGYNGYDWAYAYYGLTINTGQFDVDVTLNSSNAAQYIQDGTNYQVYLYVPTSHVWDIWPRGAMYRWDFGEVYGRFGNIWRPAVSIGHVELGYDRYVPFRNLTVRHGRVCAFNPCLREYAISVEAGRVSTRVLSTDYGVFASEIPGVDPNSTIATTTTCWAGNYTNVTSDAANPFNASLTLPDRSQLL